MGVFYLYSKGSMAFDELIKGNRGLRLDIYLGPSGGKSGAWQI
jgi:hypothetical protein